MAAERDREEAPPAGSSTTPAEERAREDAITQITRKRRFQARAISFGAVAIVLAVIWAISEYNNAGGWPSSGFSQSSSIPHTWNIWIIYPVLILGVILAIDAWKTFGRKPISESEIQREIDRTHDAR